jgi:hypothetical protein
MKRRLYPFNESVTAPANMTSNLSQTFQTTNAAMTVYEPNPFPGWRGLAFAIDEWAHRHNLTTRGPFHWFCEWFDRRLW